ncbi:MAG: amidohydrolase family protein [Candidatus Solibacter sp.]|nr:amidohydrolase family protein [Candidatus Solibacter sp.]
MEPLQCSGICALTGLRIELAFQRDLLSVSPSAEGIGRYLAPGFIDLQVNGFAGVDYNHPRTPHDQIARSLRAQFATGVTRLYPTVITGAPDHMQACLRNLAAARESVPQGHAIDGFHVEGPHISPEDGPRGAHPRQWVRPPDLDEFRRWQDATRGRIRIVTLSPEWPEAPRYIERITDEGVVASIGHTQASAAQIAAAVASGATLSTHLGNGAHQLLRRHPNYIWEQLAEERLMAGFIVDGIHLGAAFLKSAIRAKTVDRSVLVTDASTPAGAAPGRYFLADQPVDLTEDGRVVLADTDRLAGSALHMHHGVANLMRLAGLSLADAVRMASVNPARAGLVPGRAQGLVPGERADIVQFRVTPGDEIEIVATWLAGVRVF